ncbi:HAD family hydrolase [Robiginitomaculum antarcticum]|uniref:HAD family hydrolase n=1 Tax=Robiginitomaculum antarcticum TaxID=437507 RepID=UPI00036C3890|nr:HAD family hydrolase [Robiginitomaculum antarcticum]
MPRKYNGWNSDPVELIAFDFDGTITTKDTFALFLRYYAGTAQWLLNLILLLPGFIAYGLRLIDRNAVKRQVVRRFFGGESQTEVKARAEQFAREVIPGLVRPAALAEVNAKLARGEAVALVSASINDYLDVWAKSAGILKVIATRLAVDGDVLTGALDGPNCWGEGKLASIAAEMGSKNYIIAEAYGDSEGDKPMLIAAKVTFWQPFRV